VNLLSRDLQLAASEQLDIGVPEFPHHVRLHHGHHQVEFDNPGGYFGPADVQITLGQLRTYLRRAGHARRDVRFITQRLHEDDSNLDHLSEFDSWVVEQWMDAWLELNRHGINGGVRHVRPYIPTWHG